MRSTLFTAIELALKQLAKRNVPPSEYQNIVHSIRYLKVTRVGGGDKTLFDVVEEHATAIADWATNNGYSELSEHVEAEKEKAINNIKAMLGWS